MEDSILSEILVNSNMFGRCRFEYSFIRKIRWWFVRRFKGKFGGLLFAGRGGKLSGLRVDSL